jgi:oxaloacetate decarboxylase alpha subunit
VPPALDRIRKTRGPFRSDDDLLLAAFYDDTHYQALKDAGPIRTEYPLMETPLLTLVKELAMRPSIKSFQMRLG